MKRTRGTSLLEVLIAMAIMVLIVVGILQMFFVSLAINVGSSARTQLTFKAQQVAEELRYMHYMAQTYGDAQIPSWAQAIVGQSITAGSYNIPYTTSELTSQPEWGMATSTFQQGMNVVEGAKMPYRLSYTIADNTQSNTWTVTVSAAPVQDTSESSNAGTARYRGTLGDIGKRKVQYVFSMAK
jgi:type II secretory pathway pseudopilin PulG